MRGEGAEITKRKAPLVLGTFFLTFSRFFALGAHLARFFADFVGPCVHFFVFFSHCRFFIVFFPILVPPGPPRTPKNH